MRDDYAPYAGTLCDEPTRTVLCLDTTTTDEHETEDTTALVDRLVALDGGRPREVDAAHRVGKLRMPKAADSFISELGPWAGSRTGATPLAGPDAMSLRDSGRLIP